MMLSFSVAGARSASAMANCRFSEPFLRLPTIRLRRVPYPCVPFSDPVETLCITAGYPICAALIIVRSRFPPIDSKVKKEFPDERILRETFGHGRKDEAYGLRISENFWLRIAVIIQSDYKDLAPP